VLFLAIRSASIKGNDWGELPYGDDGLLLDLRYQHGGLPRHPVALCVAVPNAEPEPVIVPDSKSFTSADRQLVAVTHRESFTVPDWKWLAQTDARRVTTTDSEPVPVPD
jgi:hypothetical protein